MSLQVHLIDLVLRATLKRRFKRDPSIAQVVKMFADMERDPAKLPAGVTCEPSTLGGVPCERLATAAAHRTRALLYLHGGAFVAGSPRSHRAITGRLAAGLGVSVYSLDYRLAPAHLPPAALDDCFAAHGALLDAGFEVVVAGDSAGGTLALSLPLRLSREGVPLPAAVSAISALADLTLSSPSVRDNASAEAVFCPALFETIVANAYGGIELRDPMVSPMFGDLSNYPPVLLQVGERELLRDDSRRFAEALNAAGRACTLEVVPKVWHVWHLAAGMLPEADAALERMSAFIQKSWRAPAAP
ncbi:MAG: alpha/beta hydrolase [Myxococcaceae bacterium]